MNETFLRKIPSGLSESGIEDLKTIIERCEALMYTCTKQILTPGLGLYPYWGQEGGLGLWDCHQVDSELLRNIEIYQTKEN